MKTQKLSLYLCCAFLILGIYAMQHGNELLTALFFSLCMLTGLFYFIIMR